MAMGKGNEVRTWKPPPEGVFLINVDGAILAMDGNSGVSVVIRDWENQVVASISLPLPGKYAVEETEAIITEQGIVLAHMLGLEKIMFEGDFL
nr:hypothetical protein CFP56_74004 [Quercus suber]